jgi:NitT/TauT family transport system substrate-binding protein
MQSIPFGHQMTFIPSRCAKSIATSAWLALLCLATWGCNPPTSIPSDNRPQGGPKDSKVTLLLNWYPEAEHGGYYAALVHGYYAEEGLDVTIRPGGKSVVVAPEIELGRVQFGIGNADDVLMARSEEAKLVALMAPLQDGPRCIMVRADSNIHSLQDLKNVKLLIDLGRPYIPFLKSRGLLDSSVQTVPYMGTVTELVAGPGVAQQAYNFSEPLLAEQAGVPVRTLMLSEVGYNPYACCLITSKHLIREQPELARKMVRASIKGWQKYLTDAKLTNEFILKQNEQGMTLEALDYGVLKLKDLCLPRQMPESELGKMELERWQSLHQELVKLKLINPDKVSPQDAFDDQFLPASQASN